MRVLSFTPYYPRFIKQKWILAGSQQAMYPFILHISRRRLIMTALRTYIMRHPSSSLSLASGSPYRRISMANSKELNTQQGPQFYGVYTTHHRSSC